MSDHRQLVERLAAIEATPRASWVTELRADLDAAWETADTSHLDSGRTTPVTLRDTEPPHNQPPDRRRWSILVAAAAVALVVVAAVVFVRRDSPGTLIVTIPTPTDDSLIDVTAPLTTPPVSNEVVPVDPGPFSIIATRSFSRDLEILEITAGGTERLLRSLSPDGFGTAARFDSEGQAVSSAGWFVAWLGNLGGVVFVDLRDPTSSPRLVACRCISGRWNAAGDRYAVVGEQGTVIIDPSTGDSVAVSGYTPVDGTPEPVWTADGTALLSTSQSSETGLGDWSLTPIGGGQARSGPAPLYWQRGTRFIDDRGRWIHDRGAFTGRVTVESDGSGPDIWYDGELQPAQLRYSSFTNTGDAIWMLLTTADNSGLVLARSTAPGTLEVVIPSAPFEAVSRTDAAFIAAIAPDDSIVVVAARSSSRWDEMLLETESGASITLPAGTQVSGFVRSTLADTFPVAEP